MEALITALEAVNIQQIVFYAYGMKAEDCQRFFRGYRLPQNPIAQCRWDFGYRGDIGGDRIPLFSVDESSGGKVFPMLTKKYGSVEIKVAEGRVIVYQHLLHALKALVPVQISIPFTIGSLVKKMSVLKKLVKELKSLDQSILSEIRVELSVRGYFTFDDAADLASQYIPFGSLPDGVHVRRLIRFPRYIARIEAVIKEIETRKIFRGRYVSKVNAQQKHHLARLYNSIGFSMDRWIRHLKEPSIPSLTMTKGLIHAGDPTLTQEQLEEIARSVKTRIHPRRQDLICAIKQNGGCTKAFPDVKQLSRWIAENYAHDWQYKLLLVPSAGPKPQRKTTTSALSATFHEKVSDLTAQFDHDVIKIGRDNYILFDVPADHQCLFHSISGVLKPLYTSSRPPNYAEVRAAVITFYKTCPERLRQFLEQQWPGVATMDARAQTLENNPNEWGEHMDLQAAAIFYDVDIEVAIKTRTRQVYVDEVHSYNRNGTRSKNAKKCDRLVYYDGRSHFQIAQKV